MAQVSVETYGENLKVIMVSKDHLEGMAQNMVRSCKVVTHLLLQRRLLVGHAMALTPCTRTPRHGYCFKLLFNFQSKRDHELRSGSGFRSDRNLWEKSTTNYKVMVTGMYGVNNIILQSFPKRSLRAIFTQFQMKGNPFPTCNG